MKVERHSSPNTVSANGHGARSAKIKRTDTAGTFAIAGVPATGELQAFMDGLLRQMVSRGHALLPAPAAKTRLVLNVVDQLRPMPFRRKAQATFVATIVPVDETPDDVLVAGYPLLVRSLSNLIIMVVAKSGRMEAHFVTPERGHYSVASNAYAGERFFEEIYRLVEPLASSRLVINNVFSIDLEPELWDGDSLTQQITWAGHRLAEMDLLVAAFPVEQILSPADLRHIKRLYGLGGLSYGNLSVRKDQRRFWMSASGVDKSKLLIVGRDILMVSGYDPRQNAMIISVPPHIQPRRVSVDAIEHWIIYREHPDVGAIVHIHAWIPGIRSTQINYPCGTIELAEAVADLLRQEPDPTRAVIGLKNHGITITGPSMQDIFERIQGKIVRHVPAQ